MSVKSTSVALRLLCAIVALILVYAPRPANAQGWVPTPRGSGGGGGITCPIGDLSTGCYVQSLSGANGAGGTINLNGVTLFSVTGTGGASAQAASLQTNLQAVNATNGSSGYYIINAPAPTGAGNEGGLAVERALSVIFASQRCTPTGGSAASCIFAGNNVTPQTTNAVNFVLATDGSTYAAYNAPGNSSSSLFFEVADSEVAQFTSSAFTPGAGAVTIGTAAVPWTSFASLATGYRVFHAASAANPTSVLGDATLSFGPGGASATDVSIYRNSGALTAQVGAIIVASLGDSNNDYIALGNQSTNPTAAAGWIRVPNNVHPIASRNSTNTGDDSLVGADGADNVILGGGSNLGVEMQVGASVIMHGGISSGIISWNFDSTNGTGAGTIGWSGSSTNPVGIGIIGEQASGAVTSGGVSLVSGTPSPGSADGNITFQFAGTSSQDQVQFIGAQTSAGRGTEKWSSAITPQWMQATTSGATGVSWTWQPQQSSATPGTGGNAIVALQAPNGAGTEAFLETTRGGSEWTAMGAYSSSFGGWWGNVGTPTTGNFAIISNGATTQHNATTVQYFDINGSAIFSLQSGGVGGNLAGTNFKWNPTTVSIGQGGTTTPTANTLSNGPFLQLSATGTTSSQTVIDFSNSTQQSGSCWIIDTSQVTLGASLGFSVKYGTTTKAVTSAAQPTGDMIFVCIDSVANNIIWH